MVNDVLEDETGSYSLEEVDEALGATGVLDSNEVVMLEEAGSLAVDERTEELIDGITSLAVDEMVETFSTVEDADSRIVDEASE